MTIFEVIKEKIKAQKQIVKIVFPEGWNKTIISVANKICKEGLNIKPIVIFNKRNELPNNVETLFQPVFIEETDLSKYANFVYELRKKKNVTLEQAKELVKKSNFLASTMVAIGEADCEICGIEYSTADTLRAALQIVRPKDGTKIVCSGFIMEKDGSRLVFGDSSVNIDPKPEELAEITKSLANFAKNIALIDEVRIAMLSYSTDGSGKGDSVEKVKKAFAIVNNDNTFTSKYKCFGEIQFDAAINVDVMKKKAKKLEWNAPANVFVFPNIDAGNIGYKIAQRLGNYQAIGPVIVGLNKPVNDLSRGANENDVIQLTYITALQAINNN